MTEGAVRACSHSLPASLESVIQLAPQVTRKSAAAGRVVKFAQRTPCAA